MCYISVPNLPVYSFGANFTFSANNLPDQFDTCNTAYTGQFSADSMKKTIQDNLNVYCANTIQQDGQDVDYDITISVVEWFPDQDQNQVNC